MNMRPSPRALLLVLSTLLPFAALAAPPATVASCAGIAAAYPTDLGPRCNSNYAKINHQPQDAAQRLQTYYTRVEVLKIFRKALLCNGLYGAGASAQQRFGSGENGHLQALANLYQNMQNDPNRPAALYTAADLKGIKMNKPQCK